MAAPANSSSNLSRRLATAALLIGAVLAALYLAPGPLWLGLLALFIAAASWEWARLLGFGPILRHGFVGLNTVLGIALLTSPLPLEYGLLPAAAFWFLLTPLWLARGWGLPGPLAGAVVGALLIVPAALAMHSLREQNPHLLLMFIALTGIADSAAYFAGRAFGRRKLAPTISPGKTWEGVIGAWLAITVFALLAAGLGSTHCDSGCYLRVLALFWVLLVLSVQGDLFESWVKRRAGVKDSGALLPGHGGVLDRVDSHLAVLPVAALFWIWFFA